MRAWYVFTVDVAVLYGNVLEKINFFSKYFDLRVQMHDSSLRGGNVSGPTGQS